jgi:hypothetical protein
VSLRHFHPDLEFVICKLLRLRCQVKKTECQGESGLNMNCYIDCNVV